jgi:exonuclease III
MRQSPTLGHIAIVTSTHSKLIIAGIYGPSANDDRESYNFCQELRQTTEELQNTFHTNNLLLAGDFNVVIHPNDSSSKHIIKRRTRQLLLEIIDDFHVIDIVRYHSRGSMELNARILLLAYMVYL